MALKVSPPSADTVSRLVAFTMTESNQTPWESYARLADQIALELAFTEAGKDSGLLPLNNFLVQLEELTAEHPQPQIQGGLVIARQWVEQIFSDTGLFSAESIARFHQWTQWLQGVAQALKSGEPASAWTGLPTTTCATAEATATGGPETTSAEETLLLNVADDGELLREFINESHEHLQNIELGVLTLENNPLDADTLNSIFRAFHTFKGGSGFLNLRPINHLAHELESLLDLARQHKLVIDSEVINIILSGGDTLSQFILRMDEQLSGKQPLENIFIDTSALHVRIRAAIARNTTTAGTSTVPVETIAIQEHLPTPSSDTQIFVAPEARSGNLAVKSETAVSSVKVDTQKLDSLVDLVGEMVIAQSMVAQDPSWKASQNQQLARNLAQLSHITKELQRVSMSLRMVPIRGTFQKMTRLVRDLSVKAGKQVELELQGEDTELDRTIVEEISDPLVHMIRNSVDHGIEAPAARQTKGKAAHGKVKLNAYHKGGSIVIEISDDGNGLNRERILNKAVQQGLIKGTETLTDQEVFKFIFAAGFSTAEKITDISGRGVGMDVVRRNIEKLRGKIEIESTPGVGTTFAIHLPLTLAIIDGLIVGVGQERYIVPTLSVRESFRPRPDSIITVHERGELVSVRGRLIPLLRLHNLFDSSAAAIDPTQGIVLVVESDNQQRCLLVDHLLGKQEVVIKSLGETFKQSAGLAGAAILGDGRVGLILDVAGLVRITSNHLAHAA